MSTVTISLPPNMAKKIDIKAREQGYATRSEFVRSILRQHLAEEELKLEEFEPVPLAQLRADLAQTGKYSEQFIERVIEGFERSPLYEK